MQLFQLEYWQIIILFLPLLFVFWSLLDIQKRTFKSMTTKYAWLMACALLPIVGSILYILIGIPRTKQK